MAEGSFLETTRHAYDTIAELYVDYVADEMAAQPFDRAMLAVFAEIVRGKVLDVGCGPGRITAYLHEQGIDISGVDLAPEMIAIARRTHPDLTFEVGSMTELTLPEGELGGIVAWYSLFYIPPEHQPDVLARLYRALVPGGHLMLAWQAGKDDVVHTKQLGGYDAELISYRLDPENLIERVENAGFVLHAKLVREPNAARDEKWPQGYLIARKPD